MFENLTLLIHSCGAYSDLWSGQIEMLNRHWNDRQIRTVILTDTNPHNYSFDNVEIFCAGEGKEITGRLSAFLPFIETEYVFVTLDDYYLLHDVDNARIKELLNFMDDNNYDYLRLFNAPHGGKALKKIKKVYNVYNSKKISNYYVNLYPGIWRKSFIEKTVDQSLNAWQYEVSLTPFAIDNGIKCAMTKGKEYRILDVIRKGKVLRKAHRYFKKDPVYQGNREIMPLKDEWKLKFRDFVKCILPRKLEQKLKKRMMKRGMTFYSPLDE